MMVTLVAAALGFLASLAPHVWQFIVDKYGGKGGALGAEQLQLIQSQNDVIAAQQATIDRLTKGFERRDLLMSLMRALDSSVRPIITYSIFGIYACIKLVALWYGLFYEHVPTMSLLPGVWDESSDALMAAVVSFWFGSRLMGPSKSGRQGKKRNA